LQRRGPLFTNTLEELNIMKLGIIGISEGNGHPYSWSAICNGYDELEMRNCEYPVIPEYLSKQTWPDDQLRDAKVTHIWTQSKDYSRKIAKATYIEHIVDNPEDMIGKVDGILLARDDSQNHYSNAKPFILAGLPIYIDKPIALTQKDLAALLELEQYPGQIFSCSALRYAPELQKDIFDREAIGEIHYIDAITPKDWDRYAIHLIDPILSILENNLEIKNHSKFPITKGGMKLLLNNKQDISISITTLGRDTAGDISFGIYGSKGHLNIKFKSTFASFKAALNDFILPRNGDSHLDNRIRNKKAVEIIELGRTP
jgi:predicted dehydrogenase